MHGNNTDAIRFIFYRRGGTCWRAMLLGLLTLATLNPPAFLLAPKRPVKFERIGLEQGVSQNAISCIRQDYDGFMWFGTQEGLNKYYDYGFTV